MKIKFIPILTVFIIACSSPDTRTLQKREKKPVSTLTVQGKNFTDYLRLKGKVQARSRINILAEESGVLQKILKERGTYAEENDTLAILDNPVLKASLDQAAATLKQAELDLKSKKNLFEKKAIPEREMLLAQYRLDQAKAQYNITQARYNKLFITAPFDGYVNDRFYDRGAHVAEMTPLFDYMDHHVVRIAFEVDEEYIDDITKGTPARVTFEAIPNLVLDTKVSLVYKSIDPENRTFRSEVWLENPENKLAPDMAANVRLLRGEFKDQIVIPQKAIIESDKQQSVFIDSAGIAKAISLQIVETLQDRVVVKGIQQGTKIIIKGQNELSEGDKNFG